MRIYHNRMKKPNWQRAHPSCQLSSAVSDVTSSVKLVGRNHRDVARFQASSSHKDSVHWLGNEAAESLQEKMNSESEAPWSMIIFSWHRAVKVMVTCALVSFLSRRTGSSSTASSPLSEIFYFFCRSYMVLKLHFKNGACKKRGREEQREKSPFFFAFTFSYFARSD